MSVMKPIILVVDDEYETIQVIESALSDEYRIITADNGKTALEKISLNPPDLVLLDLFMPEMDGIEFLKKAQSILNKYYIPVIAVTGYTEESKIEAFSLGCYDVIEKPFHLLQLKFKIKKVLQIREHLKTLKKKLYEEAERLKLAWEEAKRQSHYLNSIINAVDEGIRVVDLDFTVKLANAKMEKFFNIPVSEQIGKKCFVCSPVKDCHTPLCPIERIKVGETLVNREEFYGLPQKGVWIHNLSVPFKNEKGEIIGVIQTFHDITALKKVEEELRATVEELKNTQSFLVQQGKLMAIGQLGRYCS